MIDPAVIDFVQTFWNTLSIVMCFSLGYVLGRWDSRLKKDSNG